MNIINEFELKMMANSINEAFARRLIGDFVLELNPTIEELEDIKTSVSEAVTNVVVHAYNCDNMGIITIKCTLYDNRIDIIISDNGMGIEDIDKAVEPFYTTKPGDDRSGMGIPLMKSFMSELKIDSAPNKGTKVSMTKYLSEEEDNARAK